MKAVIMAGGEGTRLRPLTANWPKPMLPIANKPMMEHVLSLLKKHGFTEVIVTVAYMANAIRTYFGDGADFGVQITYATEQVPLGTAGSVLNAKGALDEPFLVISGDVLTDVDLTKMIDFHKEKNAVVTIGLSRMENPVEFGIVICDQNCKVEKFLEKPSWGQVFSDTVNTGIYILEPEIFGYIEPDKAVDFSANVFPKILEDGGAIYGCVLDGYWEDVGTLAAYLSAHSDVLASKVKIELSGFELRSGVRVGQACEIDPSAQIYGNVIIGDNCKIGPGVRIGPDTVLGSNVRVSEGAVLERSVIHDNCYIGPQAALRSAIVGRSCDIRNNAYLDEGVVVGEGCHIGAGALIEHDVKIYPHKLVEAGAVVNSSIVWESKAARNLFGRNGVTGLANVDITPEFAVRLAMAWGSSLPKGSTVVASRDSSRAARVLKRALMVGLNATGVNVEDLEVASLAVTRFAIRTGLSQGGFSVRLKKDDPQSVVIKFFDENGIDIEESVQRKIERLYQREEFRRALAGEIGDIDFPGRISELYSSEMAQHINLDKIKKANFKAVLDYSFGTTSFVMANLLSKLGAEILAVNPYGATSRAINIDKIQQSLYVSELVKASGANLGAVIDPDGEELTIIDDRGNVLSDDLALAVFVYLVADVFSPATIAVPISASCVIDEIAKAKSATIIRTKISSTHLMEIARQKGVDFAGSTWGGFINCSFLPAFDAAGSFVFLLDLLAKTNVKISDVVNQLPPIKIAHLEILTPWEIKGALMRELVENVDNEGELELVDGVKHVTKTGWKLVLPDPERPVTHIWAEDKIAERSDALLKEFQELVENKIQRLSQSRN